MTEWYDKYFWESKFTTIHLESEKVFSLYRLQVPIHHMTDNQSNGLKNVSYKSIKYKF